MRRFRSGLLSVLLAAASLYAVEASAQWMSMTQELGFYLGSTLDRAHATKACDNFSAAGIGSNCESRNIAGRAFGGYQFNRNLAAEMGLRTFGDADATGTGGPNTGSASFRTQGVDLLAVGILPLIEDFAVYAKAGFFRWHVLSTIDRGGNPMGFAERGIDFTYALGVKYNFTPRASLLLEWQKYKDVGDSGITGKTDFNVVGIGLRVFP